jgi:hypothetical protein
MKVILSAGLIVNFLIKKKRREGRKNAMKLVTRLLSKKQCMYQKAMYVCIGDLPCIY